MTTKNSYNSLHQKIKSEWRGRWLQFRCFSLFFFVSFCVRWWCRCCVLVKNPLFSIFDIGVCLCCYEHRIPWTYVRVFSWVMTVCTGGCGFSRSGSCQQHQFRNACLGHARLCVTSKSSACSHVLSLDETDLKGALPRKRCLFRPLFFFFLHLHKVGGKRCYLCPQSAQQPFLVFGIVAWASAFLITFFLCFNRRRFNLHNSPSLNCLHYSNRFFFSCCSRDCSHG